MSNGDSLSPWEVRGSKTDGLAWACVTLFIGFGLAALMGAGRSAWQDAFYWWGSESPDGDGDVGGTP